MKNLTINFQKDPWLRRVHHDTATTRFALNYKPHISTNRDDSFVELYPSDFLNELSPAAHPINSRFMSTRPIWKATGEKDENGKEKYEIDGFDELESVSLGWQEFIFGNKFAHLTGNGGFQVCNETKDFQKFEDLSSWFDQIGLHDAFAEAVYYAERCGDSGILFLHTADGNIEWDVYSYEKGHTIFPQLDEDGKPIYYITYLRDGKPMCDIISTKSIEKWVKTDTASEESLLETLWKRFKRASAKERTEDGYVLISRKDAQCGNDLCQFVYFRIPDVSWGPVETSIEEHENAASYVANEVKDTAYPILVLKAEKATSLPPSEMNGKTIAIKGAADALAHSDVKYATPPDASNIATIHFKELNDNILRGSQSVIISPDIMKQGADSSTAIKILFRPEINWCKARWIFYQKPAHQMVKIVKVLAGKAEGNLDKYDDLRTSIWQNIWIPQNEKENTDNVVAKVYARVLSRRAALNELGSQYKGDYEQIDKEWREEIDMKARIPAEINAEYGTNVQVSDDDDKNPAKVDNNSAGKSIQNA